MSISSSSSSSSSSSPSPSPQHVTSLKIVSTTTTTAAAVSFRLFKSVVAANVKLILLITFAIIVVVTVVECTIFYVLSSPLCYNPCVLNQKINNETINYDIDFSSVQIVEIVKHWEKEFDSIYARIINIESIIYYNQTN